MRRVVSTCVVVAATLALITVGTAIGPAAAASKKPVKISGTVNVHGTKDVSTTASPTLSVALENFFFSPTFVKAKAGEVITLKLANKGNVPHTFTSDALGVDEQLSPGDTMTVDITVPAGGGAFVYHCDFHGSAGMKGAVFTKAGVKATDSAS
ncbi:MAG TPA: cupredoxin domain-containing protein [Acidimicrobiia bacterium]|nr:cupredoxin domain-containing protein [Acidimicrobiia bacterium]